MKIRAIILILFLFKFNFLNSNEISLDKQFVSVKDFLILKFDLFFKNYSSNLFEGGGLTGIAYQNLNYKIKMDKEDIIIIELDAIMNEGRYTSKKYYPKLKDCNQVRNKIVENRYGYSFFSQNFNNLVNKACKCIYSLKYENLNNLLSILYKFKKFVSKYEKNNLTVNSLNQVIVILSDYKKRKKIDIRKIEKLKSWWGYATQYIVFKKK